MDCDDENCQTDSNPPHENLQHEAKIKTPDLALSPKRQRINSLLTQLHESHPGLPGEPKYQKGADVAIGAQGAQEQVEVCPSSKTKVCRMIQEILCYSNDLQKPIRIVTGINWVSVHKDKESVKKPVKRVVFGLPSFFCFLSWPIRTYPSEGAYQQNKTKMFNWSY